MIEDMRVPIEWRGKLIEELMNDHTLVDVRDSEARKKSNISVRGNLAEVKGAFLAGRGTNINGRVQQQGRTFVGRYCAFGSGLTTINGNHRTDTVNMNVKLQKELGFRINHIRGEPNYIGHNVWAGTGVTILNGSVVGSGAVLAAGSVVTSDVMPFSISGGVPAKHIKFRFNEDVINQLLDISWWNWSIDRMSRNDEFFNKAIGSDEKIDLIGIVRD